MTHFRFKHWSTTKMSVTERCCKKYWPFSLRFEVISRFWWQKFSCWWRSWHVVQFVFIIWNLSTSYCVPFIRHQHQKSPEFQLYIERFLEKRLCWWQLRDFGDRFGKLKMSTTSLFCHQNLQTVTSSSQKVTFRKLSPLSM